MKRDGLGTHAGSAVYRDRPFVVTWEATRPRRGDTPHTSIGSNPDELSTNEVGNVVDRLARRRVRVFRAVGRDPMAREDLEDVIAHANDRGLKGAVSVPPGAARTLRARRIESLADAGLDQIGFRLDGPTAQAHDTLHHTPGSYDATIHLVDAARAAHLPVEVESVISARNVAQLDALIEVVNALHVASWEASFVARPDNSDRGGGLTWADYVHAFERLHALERRAPFVVKLREAPHYQRFVVESWHRRQGDQRLTRRHRAAPQAQGDWSVRTSAGDLTDVCVAERAQLLHHAFKGHTHARAAVAQHTGLTPEIGVSLYAADAGRASLHIDHVGNVSPSEMLPLVAGNVRRDPIVGIYRNSHLFRELHDRSRLKGKCGRCPFNATCGGSRARAWAVTGDHMAADPGCGFAVSPAG